jgi:hypothetical protein
MVYPRPRPRFEGRLISAQSPRAALGPPSAQSPFAACRCDRHAEDVTRLLAGHCSHFIAPTGSCAKPLPSCCPWLCLWLQVFAGCCQPLLRNGPSRRYPCRSCPACLDLHSGCSRGARARYFPRDNGLPQVETRSAQSQSPRQLLLSGYKFRSCRHLPTFRPTSLLATQVAPTLASCDVGQPWLLPPRISRFVSSPCSGYAHRPNPGN